MNIHEYQGKEILEAEFAFNVESLHNAVEAVAAKHLTTETGTSWYVVCTGAGDVKRCRLTYKKFANKLKRLLDKL
jgi:invasion protein IalB